MHDRALQLRSPHPNPTTSTEPEAASCADKDQSGLEVRMHAFTAVITDSCTPTDDDDDLRRVHEVMPQLTAAAARADRRRSPSTPASAARVTFIIYDPFYGDRNSI